jgi:hypothetical protein
MERSFFNNYYDKNVVCDLAKLFLSREWYGCLTFYLFYRLVYLSVNMHKTLYHILLYFHVLNRNIDIIRRCRVAYVVIKVNLYFSFFF